MFSKERMEEKIMLALGLLLVYGIGSPYVVAKSTTELTAATAATSTTSGGCGSPGSFKNGSIQFSSGTSIGSVASFTCDDDFFISGTCKQNTTSECLPSGIWNVSLPQCTSKDFGVLFNISKNPFYEGSYENVVMSCQPSNDLSNNSVGTIEIRRTLPTSSTWETIVILNSTNVPTAVGSSGLANKAKFSVSHLASGPVLTLTVNESLLACEDAALYQCYVPYTTNNGQCYGEKNKKFNGVFFPRNVDLEGAMNGNTVQSSSMTNPAQLQVGDILELNCTAQIGNDPTATISWSSSNSFSNGALLPGQISGALTQGSAKDYHNCQYTRSAIIKHTVSNGDLAQGNLSYSCNVEVFTPVGTKNTEANHIFYAEIYSLCPRPPSPTHGSISITGTNAGSDVFLTCDPGYTRSTGFAVCASSGKWDAPLTCDPIGCSELPPLINGITTLSNLTYINSTASFSCYYGYALAGNTSSTCRDESWDTDPPVCNAIACGNLTSPTNGFVISNSGFEAGFDCQEGYEITGNSTLNCEAGQWSSSPPNCSLIECEIQDAPENGVIVSSDGNKVNSTTISGCDIGYHLQGSNTSSCLPDGNWSSIEPKCLPIECQALSNLDQGSVALSDKMFYQSNGTFSCNNGYYMVGFNTTQCTASGTWTNPVPECKPVDCGSWTYQIYLWSYYSHVTYSKNTTFGSTAICYCNTGFQIDPATRSVAATCNESGIWSINSPPLCVEVECPPLNVTKGVQIEYNSIGKRSVNSTATFSCNETDNKINGYEKVTCLSTGEWTGSSPNCSKIEEGVSPCPEDIDFHQTLWNATQPGTIFTKKCQENYNGEISRQCTDKGQWHLPIYNCVRKDIEELDKRIEAIAKIEKPSEEVVTQALDQLTDITKPSSNTDNLYGGEIEKVTSILESIANISTKLNVTDSQAVAFLETTSNLLDTSNTNSWKSISQEPERVPSKETQNKQTKGATKILDVVSHYTDSVATSLQNAKNTSKTVSAPNLVLHVSKIGNDTAEMTFPLPNEKREFNLTSSFSIPGESLSGLEHVSSVVYKNLSGILSSATISNGQVDMNQEINSAVLTVNVPDWKNNSDKFSVTLTLGHFQINQGKLNDPRCNYWNESLAAWDGTGCTLDSKSSTANQSVCKCDHLTNFAILMSPWQEENVDTLAIDIISTVGCSVSLLALVVTVVAHVALWRYVKSDRVVLLMNLSVALVISYAIFLGGVDRTENKDACTAVAALLQYIYLVIFFLMLAEGIEIAVTVLYVFHTESRLKWLLPCAWLIPAVIVGISLGATKLKGFGNEQFCWLSVKGGLIWAFVAPAFTIILVNFVLLILVMRAAFRTTTLSQKSRMEKTKAGVKCLCVLLPVMGCTWVIGIFYVNEDMAWIQYVFAVCNSLQGLVIFFFHCALDKKVRTGIQRQRQKYNVSLLSTVSTNKQFSMPRASMKSKSSSEVEMSDSFSGEDASRNRF